MPAQRPTPPCPRARRVSSTSWSSPPGTAVFFSYVAALACPKARARLLVLRPWRAEDVKHTGALRSSPHGVRHIAGRAPEIALLDLDLFVALDADGRAFEQHAPLLLGMMMQGALRIRRDRHYREHRLLAGEDARR